MDIFAMDNRIPQIDQIELRDRIPRPTKPMDDGGGECEAVSFAGALAFEQGGCRRGIP